MNLTDGMAFWARWAPEKAALSIGDVTYSWADLAARSDRLAAGLADQGVRHGDRVALFAGNDVRWYDTVFAALKLGAVLVPINVRLPAPTVGHILDDADCALVVADSQLGRVLRQIPHAMTRYSTAEFGFGRGDGSIRFDDLYSADPLPPGGPVPDDVAVIAFTSGTTGEPKGVVLTHGGVLAFVNGFARAAEWDRDTRFLHVGSFAYTAGVMHAILGQSIVGGTLIVENEFEPARLARVLLDERITAWNGLPAHWDALTRVDGFPDMAFPRLTSTVTGGGALSPTLMETLRPKGVTLRYVYGITEAGGTVTMPSRETALTAPRSVGKPLMHNEVRIVVADRSDLRDVAAGDLGEIVIRGGSMMREYWRKPDATREVLVDGWVRTGDIGRFDADGLLYVIDRKNEAIRASGTNVYPAEIERVVLDHPDVVEAAAVGIPDAATGSALLLVVHGTAHLDLQSVLGRCQRQLPPHAQPRHILATAEPLPRSLTGKVMRRQVRDSYLSQLQRAEQGGGVELAGADAG